MKKLSCLLLATFATVQIAAAVGAGTHNAAAANTTTATSPAQTLVAGKTEPKNTESKEDNVPPAKIESKNKSSFALEPNSRNPFWPIGWKPAPKQNANNTEQAGPEISPTAFVISSIMMGNGAHFAIINGKPMQEGQVFGLQMGNQVYQITVKTIEDGQVILQRRDQEFAVPLRRK
jgi:hypothetical protein